METEYISTAQKALLKMKELEANTPLPYTAILRNGAEIACKTKEQLQDFIDMYQLKN